MSRSSDQEQNTELAVPADGGTEVRVVIADALHIQFQFRCRGLLSYVDPPGGVGPQDDIPANRALGPDQIESSVMSVPFGRSWF